MFEAVIFDCDGVLVNSEKLILDVEREQLAQKGLHFSRQEFIDTFMGHSFDYFQETLKTLCDERGLPRLTDAFFAALQQEKRTILEQELEATDGVASLLMHLQRKKAVATNSYTEPLTFKLDKTGLAKYFGTHAYARDMVKNGKPAPDIYLHAAAQLGVNPSDCVVIEDSVQGTKAGISAGMAVIGYTGGGHCPEGHDEALRQAGAGLIVPHMKDLYPILLSRS